MTKLSELLACKKNFVFIGETGSGKSEIALNVAAMLQKRGGRSVHVFDLDQTKAMFRSRDAEQEMQALGITVHYMPQLLDSPVMVNGIIPHLVRKDSASILDVGGNENAARMVGCLSDYLNGENTAAIYVLNPYRPWSGSREEIRRTMETVLNACHIQQIYFVANPSVGLETTAEDVTAGLSQLKRDLPVEQLSAVFVKEGLLSSLCVQSGVEYILLHPYLTYPWDKPIEK